MGDLRDAGEDRRGSAAVSDHGGEADRRGGMVKMAGAKFATRTPTALWGIA
jgi:hypothetical protein